MKTLQPLGVSGSGGVGVSVGVSISIAGFGGKLGTSANLILGFSLLQGQLPDKCPSAFLVAAMRLR